MKDLHAGIRALWDIRPRDVLVAAWRESAKLKSAYDSSREHPDKPTKVPLAEHTIEAIYSPYIEVQEHGVATLQLDMRLHIAMRLEGVVLTVLNGDSKSVRTGAAEAAAKLKLGAVTLLEFGPKTINLPGMIALA
ncbi:MAG: hypothetical protein HYZ53_28520 [Planctomycetes bacterium]|nr:hypothetical protein [Planctomycetota bacterium]